MLTAEGPGNGARLDRPQEGVWRRQVLKTLGMLGLGTAAGTIGCGPPWTREPRENRERAERRIAKMPMSAVVLPDGRIAVFYTLTGSLTEAVFKIIDPRTGDEEGPYLAEGSAMAPSVAVSPERLAIATRDLAGRIVVRLLSARGRELPSPPPPSIINREDPSRPEVAEIVGNPSTAYCPGLGGYVVLWKSERKREDGKTVTKVFFNIVDQNGQKIAKDELLEDPARGDVITEFVDEEREDRDAGLFTLRGDTPAIVVENVIYALSPRAAASNTITPFSPSVRNVALCVQPERDQVLAAGIDGGVLKVVKLPMRREGDLQGGHLVLDPPVEAMEPIAEGVENLSGMVLPDGNVLLAWTDEAGGLYLLPFSESGPGEAVAVQQAGGAKALFPTFAKSRVRPHPVLTWLEEMTNGDDNNPLAVRAVAVVTAH